jgi:site-specific recombinase XerD
MTVQFESDVLFVTYEGNQLADNIIRKNLRDWGAAASIRIKRISPHTFRHTGALFYIMNGGTILRKVLCTVILITEKSCRIFDNFIEHNFPPQAFN